MSYSLIKVVRELAISLGGGTSLPNLRYQGDLGLVDIGLSSRKYQPNLVRLCSWFSSLLRTLYYHYNFEW